MQRQSKRLSESFRRAKISAVIAGGLCAVFGLAGCQEEQVSGDCVDNVQYFKEAIWSPIMSQNCIQCHTSTGAAKHTDLILVNDKWGPDWLERNLEVVEELAKRTYEGESWLLLKPTKKIEHGGGERFKEGSAEYDAFVELVRRIENPVVCEDQGIDHSAFFDGVVLLDEVATLRKAALSLVGRLPTIEEEQRVRDGGFDALDVVLDEMMTEEAFFDRLKEIYNDYFLTDRYLSRANGTPAIDLLDVDADYPNAYWFDELPEGEYEYALQFSNDAVAREALELVAHVVRNERPFTEILTADYTLVNPWSAQVYGVSGAFQDPTDPTEFVEARLGFPHAGVLTSHMMMNRFSTTPTNRNRHRARKIFEFFLATDVQRLGDRPIDPANIEDFNPTMNNPNCTLCHAIIDPVAGALQNFDDMGRYRPPVDGWYTDMRPPGFDDRVLDPGKFEDGSPWLGQQIAADPRFASSVVHVLFKGLSGQEPLREPTDTGAEDYLARIRAFDVQSQIFGQIAEQFRESDYDLRIVVKQIVKTPYYRATDAVDLSDERAMELQDVGTGRLLTPEQLHRKVEAVTGYPWRENRDYLLDLNWYRIFYGGIDSDSVVERITEPNGIMANVAARMANEMACWTTARDFVLPAADRRLFRFVERTFEPEDGNGFEVAAAAAAIRANIQYLHERMLGEFVDLNDPEVDRTYELFLHVWKDGKVGIAAGEYPANLPGECRANSDFFSGEPLADDERIENDPQYTIRAWMAVMTYLLSDYRFLHE